MANYFPDTSTGFERYPHLSAQQKTLIRVLLTFRNSNSGECFPSQVRLAKILRVKRETVSKWLKKLRDYGLLDYFDVPLDSGQHRRLYVLNERWINSLDITPDKDMDWKLDRVKLPYSRDWVREIVSKYGLDSRYEYQISMGMSENRAGGCEENGQGSGLLDLGGAEKTDTGMSENRAGGCEENGQGCAEKTDTNYKHTTTNKEIIKNEQIDTPLVTEEDSLPTATRETTEGLIDFDKLYAQYPHPANKQNNEAKSKARIQFSRIMRHPQGEGNVPNLYLRSKFEELITNGSEPMPILQWLNQVDEEYQQELQMSCE